MASGDAETETRENAEGMEMDSRDPLQTSESPLSVIIGTALSFCGGILCLGALALWGYEIYIWFKAGAWPGFSLLMLVDGEWAKNPQDWIGLHILLSKIPLPLPPFLLGIVFQIIGGSIHDPDP